MRGRRIPPTLLGAVLALAAQGCAAAAAPAGHTISATAAEPAPPAGSPSSEAAPSNEVAGAPAIVEAEPATTSTPTELVPPAIDAHAASAFELRVEGEPTLEALSDSGAWLAYCETHDGSSRLRLAIAADPAHPDDVDALLAISPGGRFVVEKKGSTIWLVDAQAGARLDLSALGADLDGDSLPDHRSFSFSSDDEELALLRPNATSAVVLSLAKWAELPAAPLATISREVNWEGPAWRLEYQGRLLVVRLAVARSRHRAWPVPRATTPPRRCDAHLRFAAFGALTQVDAAAESPVRLLAPGASRAEEAPGFVFALGSGWVRREDDGRLVLVEGTVQKQLASAKCGARIVHADAVRRAFVVACEQYRPKPAAEAPSKKKKGRAPAPPSRFPLYLVGPGWVVDLGADTARTGIDSAPDASGSRYAAVRPGSESALVDLVSRRLIALGPDATVLGSAHERALLKRGQRISTWTPSGEQPVQLPWQALAPLWLRGEYLLHASSFGPIQAPLCLLGERQQAFGLGARGSVASYEALGSGVGSLRVIAPCQAADAAH